MAPINPASQMPITYLAIAHKRVESLCEAIESKHSVNDRERDSTFCGHGTMPLGLGVLSTSCIADSCFMPGNAGCA
jgi:hypothetical protein